MARQIVNRPGAVADLETAIGVWRQPGNPAIEPLEKLYRDAGETAALEALEQRVKSFKVPSS